MVRFQLKAGCHAGSIPAPYNIYVRVAEWPNADEVKPIRMLWKFKAFKLHSWQKLSYIPSATEYVTAGSIPVPSQHFYVDVPERFMGELRLGLF